MSTLKYNKYKNLTCLVQAGLVQTKFEVVKSTNNNLEWRERDGHGRQKHGEILKKIMRTMTHGFGPFEYH